MSVSINKDTKIYGSFSKTAGNKGCEFFNKTFSDHKVNAIYKSFSVDNIHAAVDGAIALKFSGFAVSMPYKQRMYDLVSITDSSAEKSKSVNTVILDHNKNKLTGYSTDYHGALKLLYPYRNDYNEIYILGNGGLSGAVQAAAKDLNFNVKVITRKDWSQINELKNVLIYNCTPLSLKLNLSNCYIDCLIGTGTGDLLHKYQSHKQFELYTGIKLDDNV